MLFLFGIILDKRHESARRCFCSVEGHCSPAEFRGKITWMLIREGGAEG